MPGMGGVRFVAHTRGRPGMGHSLRGPRGSRGVWVAGRGLWAVLGVDEGQEGELVRRKVSFGDGNKVLARPLVLRRFLHDNQTVGS